MALPVRLDHCVIHVSDWQVSNAFYSDVVGAELVESGGRTRSARRRGAVVTSRVEAKERT